VPFDQFKRSRVAVVAAGVAGGLLVVCVGCAALFAIVNRRPAAPPEPTPAAASRVSTLPAPPAAATAAATATPGVLTATRAPLPTATPGAAAVEPTPSPYEFDAIGIQSYTDGGRYHIVGEVRNNTDIPTTDVKVTATFYDGNGQVVGAVSTYTALDVIPPHGKAPFDIATDQSAASQRYSITIEGRPGQLPQADVVLLSHGLSSANGRLHVSGEVQNVGTGAASAVKVVVTLYDAAGKVLDGSGVVDLGAIPAGGTAAFDVAADQNQGFDHYYVQVQAQ